MRPRKTSRQSLLHFTRQLRVFVKGGIPLGQAIGIIADETSDVGLRRALESILEDLDQGGALSEGFERHPHIFPPYFIGLVRSAEATGAFADALDSLAAYQARLIESRSRLTSALTYPSIVMALALGTVVILAGFVIPRFEPLFEELGSTLPLPTRLLVNTTSAVSSNVVLLSIGFAICTALVVTSIRTRRGRRIVDTAILRLPIIGTIVRYILLERFCRIFAASLRSGLAVTSGIRLSIATISNSFITEKLSRAARDIVMGIEFSKALSRIDLFPGAVQQMFRVGEETGSLDEQITAAAEFFDSELEQRMRRFTALFEPILIVFVGVVVGFVAVALISAMYGVLDGVRDVP